MPDYWHGKIYKMRVLEQLGEEQAAPAGTARHDKTAVACAERGAKCKRITSSIIIDKGEYHIEILEPFPCFWKHQLLDREAYYIRRYRTLGLPIVNRNIPGRSVREYCEDNKAERAARDRIFRATHPDYYKNYRRTQPYRDACKELRAIGGY